MKPLAVDLCCGLGGWTNGLLTEGWDVVGFDVERHIYGDHKYPAQLVIQDILTLDGRQFRGKVSLITASPPCQFFSYCAMPWSRAKALAAKVRADPALLEKELALFKACVRIGQEAECPIIIENVRGAQKWVGRARWNYGSFYLWGDVPALMPPTLRGTKVSGHSMSKGAPKWNMHHKDCVESAIKNNGVSWFNIAHNTTSGKGRNPDGRKMPENVVMDALAEADDGRKGYAAVLGQSKISRAYGSKSPQRKMASAIIAKIPFPLARYIATTFKPRP